MKITKHVTVEVEVDVDVGTEDIAAILAEEPESPHKALAAVSNMHKVLIGLPDSIIAGLNANARELISKFFSEQAARFKP